MEYQLQQCDGELRIEIARVGAARDRLLAAFTSCREGCCRCPTREYGKLASLHIEEEGEGLVLRLVPQPGQRLDPDAIRRCLDFTAAAAAQER